MSGLRLRMSDRDQYYTLATSAVFFYEFLLTLEDEVSHIIDASFLCIYCLSRERSDTVGREGNHGVCREDRLSYGTR